MKHVKIFWFKSSTKLNKVMFQFEIHYYTELFLAIIHLLNRIRKQEQIILKKLSLNILNEKITFSDSVNFDNLADGKIKK